MWPSEVTWVVGEKEQLESEGSAFSGGEGRRSDDEKDIK